MSTVAEQINPATDPPSQTGKPRRKVLMADDSISMRTLLQAQLTRWGLDVIAAENGAQAWELFQQHEPSLVLTDWMMPEMDGLELIRRIRESEVDHYVYVILLTAKTEKDDLVHAMDAGADDFLVKPCDNQELRVRLREGTRILELERSLAEKNREIRHAQAALIQSEKLASLGQLAAGMAHEINNPIAYVSNNLSVLRRDIASLLEVLQAYRGAVSEDDDIDPELAKHCKKLEQEHDIAWIEENMSSMFDASIGGLTRVRDIVSNLRDFARLDEAEFDTVSIGGTIRSTLSIMKHMFDEKQVNVVVNDQSKPVIHCRPARINQVLHNLLMNAIQACDIGDKITINVSSDSETVEVEIVDTGCGISAEDLPRIFEPFFTTRAIGSGTGLGLSHCYGVVREHGGDIDVISEPGEGTTVRLQLPRQIPTHDPAGK